MTDVGVTTQIPVGGAYGYGTTTDPTLNSATHAFTSASFSSVTTASVSTATLASSGIISANGGTDTHSSTAVSTPTVTSGTAFTPSATLDSMVYFQLTAGGAGSYVLQMGPTLGTENTIGNAVAVLSGGGPLVTLRVPASWKVKLTVTTITIGGTTVVTC